MKENKEKNKEKPIILLRVELPDGTLFQDLKGEIGPVIIDNNNTQAWFKTYKMHRLDGPARIYADGSKDYFINGKELNTEEVENWIRNNNINLKAKKGQSLFMLKFG